MKKKLKISIINLEINNLHSIYNACIQANYNTQVLEKKDKLSGDIVILPGIGSYSSGMKEINKRNLKEKILDYIYKPNTFFYGICLGMQLLFEKSCEFKITNGINLIDGEVKKIKKQIVPHTGWNTFKLKKNLQIKSFSNNYFYFVHSYICVPKNKDYILANTYYRGLKFCSIVKRNNIFGTQFHPEKSGKKGIEFLETLKKFLN